MMEIDGKGPEGELIPSQYLPYNAILFISLSIHFHLLLSS